MDYLSSWIEIPVIDMKRAQTFYGKLLDIQFAEMTLGPMQYAFFPAKDKKNTGALVKSEYSKPSPDGVRIYLETGESVEKLLAKAVQAGGVIIQPRTFVSDEGGYIGICKDTEGNFIGLHDELAS